MITLICLVAAAGSAALAVRDTVVFGRSAAIIPSILAVAFVAAAFV